VIDRAIIDKNARSADGVVLRRRQARQITMAKLFHHATDRGGAEVRTIPRVLI
jgi:hypothetical protein